MSAIRAAVVGTGFIGPVHVEALRRAGVEVVGIVGSTAEKSVSAARRLRIPKGFATFEDCIDSDEVDSVHITTPNRYHFDQAAAALRAGKHVVCEKPLAMNSSESSELIRIANESGRAAAVAYNIRFYPLCHEAASRVRSGAVGDVIHVCGSYVQDWLLRQTDFNWRVLADDGGQLRAVADIGTHWLDLIQFITGKKIASVCADLRTVYPTRYRPTGGVETFSGKAVDAGANKAVEIATEDCGSVMFRFGDQTNGCMWVSQTTAGRKNCLRFEIAGTRHALAFDSENPNLLWIGHRDSPNQSLIRDPALMHDQAAAIANYPGGHCEGFPDTFKQLFRTFYRYVEAGDLSAPRDFPTFEDGHREILICEAILKSNQNRNWVDVG